MKFFKKIFSTTKIKEKNTADNEHFENNDMEHTKLFVLNKNTKAAKLALPAIIKVIAGVDYGLEVSVENKHINIGRLPGSEMLLKDTGVSRLHAFIINENGYHILCDGKSTNGTYLNNQRIIKKSLTHGDSIKIANTVMVYELQ